MYYFSFVWLFFYNCFQKRKGIFKLRSGGRDNPHLFIRYPFSTEKPWQKTIRCCKEFFLLELTQIICSKYFWEAKEFWCWRQVWEIILTFFIRYPFSTEKPWKIMCWCKEKAVLCIFDMLMTSSLKCSMKHCNAKKGFYVCHIGKTREGCGAEL